MMAKIQLKKWKPFDFDVKNLRIEGSGIVVEKSEGNTIVLQSDWPNRRIQYRCNWI